MNNKLSIRRRRGGWFQVRTRYCAFYVRLGDRGAVWGDYETESERARLADALAYSLTIEPGGTTMKYRIAVNPSPKDGMKEDPGHVVTVSDVDELMGHIPSELCNDYGQPLGPGATLLIERLT